MSPLFGHKDEDAITPPSADPTLQAEVERLSALTLQQLAVEVMTKGFGPGGPGADEPDTVTTSGPNFASGPTVGDIAAAFNAVRAGNGPDQRLRLFLNRLVAEGLQVLEHECLIRAQMHTEMNGLDYALTRIGRTALQQGTVERILGTTPA